MRLKHQPGCNCCEPCINEPFPVEPDSEVYMDDFSGAALDPGWYKVVTFQTGFVDVDGGKLVFEGRPNLSQSVVQVNRYMRGFGSFGALQALDFHQEITLDDPFVTIHGMEGSFTATITDDHDGTLQYLYADFFIQSQTAAAEPSYTLSWRVGFNAVNTVEIPDDPAAGDVLRIEMSHDAGNAYQIALLLNGVERAGSTETATFGSPFEDPCAIRCEVYAKEGLNSGTTSVPFVHWDDFSWAK